MLKSRNEYYHYIRETISIEKVCDRLGIVIKPVGKDYVCSCIYHNDPHPSMHIYSETKSFYCFECDRGGNIFTLLEHKLKCNFYEALKWLEEEYPQLLREKPAINAELDNAYGKTGYEVAYEEYANMTEFEKNQLQLFAEQRGYKAEVLKESGIFYAEGRKLYNAYGKNADQHIEEIEKLKESQLITALPMRRTDQKINYEDYFQKDRIIITLYDEKRKICGFAGRSVKENDKPKYLFTKKLPKSQILYRIDSVEKELRKNGESKKLFIVEGMFDALRLETRGYCAVAVLGNRLLDKQIEQLEYVIDKSKANVSLSLFLDTDIAGLNGTIASIKRIWKNKILKKCYLEVQVLTDGTKDPDEALKEKERTKGVSYTAFEFLMRYYLKENEEALSEVDLKGGYAKLTTEARILLLHKMEDMLPKQEWEELFNYYDRVMENEVKEKEISDNIFSYLRIRSFILGERVAEVNTGWNTKLSIDEKVTEEEKDYRYQMQTALQIARTSYERENVPLDTTTWERIALGADAFFDYLYEMLKREETIPIPMITMQVPKKLEETRKKAMCCQEELLLQQYVLNELLSRGEHEGFVRNIPAIRYGSDEGICVTGYQYSDLVYEVVSFAYQIDMSAISGTIEIKNGMYRPFYECWKSYIGYIQDGIEKLQGETVYRVKLDVQGFYDNLRSYVIRDAIYPSIEEALKYDEGKFRCFRNEDSTNKELAEKVVEWILKELFKEEYYDSKDGVLKQKDEYDCGIPQGPNLSSYVANIALFSVDQKVQKIIREVNASCEEGKIKARYARYVDDMIIIASSPDILLRLKEAVAVKLYELNLNLSPKTEEEDGISKEDAFDWTTEERGGFGVSAGFDMPDDTITSLIEEYEDYEVTNRRDALKLLQSSLNTLLYEGIEEKEEMENFFSAFFQTEGLRYLDIVRFSEMLIYYAAKQEENLKETFQKKWQDGKELAQEESLFFEEGLEVLVFLDGCRRILLRQENPGNPQSYKTWEFVNKKIKAEKDVICEWVIASISDKKVLEENQWILNLKLMEFAKLTNGYLENEVEFMDCSIEGKNEYWYRWKWHVVKNRKELMKLRPESDSGKGVLQDFHFFMEALRKIEKVQDFDEQKSIFQNYKIYENVEDILLNCFKIWTSNDGAKKAEDKERALRILLNTIPSDYKTEIIGQIEELKEYLFSEITVQQNYEYLPVYPGVRYPGIIVAIKENTTTYINEIKRVDLSSESENILNEEDWELEDEKEKRRYFGRKLNNVKVKYINLKDYCQLQGELNARKVLQIVADLYLVLQEKLLEINKKIEEKLGNKKLLLSSRNVVLEIHENEIPKIDVENAYLISSQITPDMVAIEKGNEQYELQTVYGNGSAYWISGYLLKDACKVDEVRFAALEKGNEEIQDAEILKYSMKRLYGHTVQRKGTYYRGEKSYKKSVERTINLIRSYLVSIDEDKALFLEDAKIINSFIEKKLNNEYGKFLDSAWECSIWAKNYLHFGFHSLKNLFIEKKNINESNWQVERRVPTWYCYLAEQINQLYQKNKDFYGLRVLTAGLYADAVLMLMRMQVLECIRALDDKQRESFLTEADDYPFQELGIEGNELFMIQGDISLVYRNFLNKKDDDGIKRITHLGWLVLLAKIYEIDKRANFIVFHDKKKIDRNRMGTALKKVADIITAKRQEDEMESFEFPFEEMSQFFYVWRKENVIEILKCLDEANKMYGAVVEKKFSDQYRQRTVKKQVRIDTGQEIYNEQKYFLTFGKAGSCISEVEACLEEPSQFIYTQTSIRGTVVGISTLAHEFGEVLQFLENRKLKKEDIQNKDTIFLAERQSKNDEILKEEEVSIQTEPEKAERITKVQEKERQKKKSKGNFQSTAWSRRGKTKFFANADRIALFQFHIDSSYRHPAVEKCTLKEKEDKKSFLLYSSCAEFRRRKLLESVLKTCEIFGVEILLLPEYSVRPETVQWMYEIMQKNGYNFSIWAGTFRIPAGYHFDGNGTIEQAELNEKIFWHSAPLPIILNTGYKKAEIIIKKFKKYPAVALKEDINPAPAYEIYKTFSPVMHKYAAEKRIISKQKDVENIMPYFYDARDDVIELICAELFAVASLSNYPSFLKESLIAYSNYARPDLLEKKKVYENYEKKYMNNLQEFGRYTALYQWKKRYIRTPILLVPACATRVVDYYVFGQGFYLSAGLKTVLCNAVETKGGGGSCFIGPDSWDNRNLKPNEYLMENTIYHGLKPGIFMQTSQMENRGALGDKEQALLICDVYPELDKRNPNSESMMSAFSLVAHIPIFEEKNYEACCKENSTCKYCGKYERDKAQERRKEFEKARSMIESYCEKKLINSFFYDEENTKEDMQNVVKELKKLGETYQSDWFVRRAEYYEKYYKMYPQAWPPPTLTDWMYIEIDYSDFLKNSKNYGIQIPQKN